MTGSRKWKPFQKRKCKWKLNEIWSKRCIYEVAPQVTELNKKAYGPQVVSFGPYHHAELGTLDTYGRAQATSSSSLSREI
ncbi:hypothetical protein LguiA_020645 [Lonicera macranthoides]